MYAFLTVCVIVVGILIIVKWGIQYSENIERMKNGYPALDGTTRINNDDINVDHAGKEHQEPDGLQPNHQQQSI